MPGSEYEVEVLAGPGDRSPDERSMVAHAAEIPNGKHVDREAQTCDERDLTVGKKEQKHRRPVETEVACRQSQPIAGRESWTRNRARQRRCCWCWDVKSVREMASGKGGWTEKRRLISACVARLKVRRQVAAQCGSAACRTSASACVLALGCWLQCLRLTWMQLWDG
jgi:hypothetical protein